MSEGYDELYLILLHLQDAAITAQLNVMHYFGDVHHGFHGNGINIAPIWNPDKDGPDAKITGPHGEVAGFVPDVHYPFHSVGSIVDYFTRGINEAFQPWFELPDPDHFDDSVAHARRTAEILALDAVGSCGPGAGALRFGANVALSKRLGYLQDGLADSSGAAIRSFDENYAQPLPSIVSGQDACACALWVGTAGEQRIWDRARTCVAAIAHEGVRAMQLADGPSADISAVLNVVGTFASVLGLVTGDVVVGAEAEALGLLQKVLPTPHDEHVPLGADEPMDVLANIKEALRRLSHQIAIEERALADGFDATIAKIADQPLSYNIDSPRLVRDDNPQDFRAPTDIQVDFDILRHIANVTLPAASNQFRAAAHALVEADQRGLWQRNDRVGLGQEGAYPSWRALQRIVVGLTSNTARELDAVGDTLDVVARSFRQTDAQLEHALRAQTKRVSA